MANPIHAGVPVVPIAPLLWRRVAALWLLSIMLVGCGGDTALEHQIYIWQRQWRPAHREALHQSSALLSGLRVLAHQLHEQTGWVTAQVDLQLLAQDGRPVIVVIRLDGAIGVLDAPRILAQLQSTIAHWQAAGVALTGVEIDYDCGTAMLPHYAEALRQWRAEIPTTLSLSITALPAWLDSVALDAVLAAVDHSVLQVHAVQHPDAGLFAPAQAWRWTERWAARTAPPFYLALPAYGVAVIADGGDNKSGGAVVESEVPLAIAGLRREVSADPHDVAQLLSVLQVNKPASLRGVIWFRLPLAHDRRAWPWPTLQAVISQQRLQARLQVRGQASVTSTDLVLHNIGNAPAILPERIELAATGCDAGDAVAGYRYHYETGRVVFIRHRALPTLPAGQQRALGWLNCKNLNKDVFDVQL